MAGRRRGRPPHPDVLTPAEWRVLGEVRTGATNAEIAVRLGISVSAVKYHVGNMLAKLNLEDRHQLAAWRPRLERRRLRGLLSVPVGLGVLGRPFAWAGVGTALAGGVATVAVVLVVLARGDGADVTLVPATATPVTQTVTAPPSTPPHTEAAAPARAVTSTPMPRATPPVESDQTSTGLRRIEGLYTPRLLVVNDGAPDSLILEWTVDDGYEGAAEAVDGYQYRKRGWVSGEWQPWGQWVHIAGSEGVMCLSGGPRMATCSYRVTGLRPDTVYNFAVRSGSYALFAAKGVTQREGVTPHMWSYTGVAKGDGQMAWSVSSPLGSRLVIPKGMRLRNESPQCIDCGSGFVLVDVETGSRLRYWSTWGGPRTPPQQLVLPQCQRQMDYSLTVLPDRTRGRDVAALFNQLVAPPPPLPSTCSYEFSPLEYALLPETAVSFRYTVIPVPADQ